MKFLFTYLLVALLVVPAAYARLSNSQVDSLISRLETATGRDRDRIISDLAYGSNTRAFPKLKELAEGGDRDALRGLGNFARYSSLRGQIHEVSISAIQSDNSRIRGAAEDNFSDLARNNYSRSTTALVDLLEAGESSSGVESNVISALGWMDASAGINEIRERLNGSDVSTAREAADALSRISGGSSTQKRQVREDLIRLATAAGTNDRLRNDAFESLTARARSYGANDRNIVPALVSIYDGSHGSVADSVKRDALEAAAWTGDTRVRASLVEAVDSSDPRMVEVGIEGISRDSNYYGSSSVLPAIVKALGHSDSKVVDEAIFTANMALGRQWSRMNSSKRRDMMSGLAKALRSSSRSDRRSAARLIAEYIHPYFSNGSVGDDLKQKFLACLGYDVNTSTVTGEELRKAATYMGIIITPFLFYAMFANPGDSVHQSFDVDNVPQWTDSDVAAFESIIGQIIK